MIPLRWKLVGLYALILAAVIGAFSVVLAAGVRASLVQTMDRELEARAKSVVALAELDDGEWHVERKSGLHEEYVPGHGLFYLIQDATGAVVLASEPGLEPPPAEGYRETSAGGRTYREFTSILKKGRDRKEGGRPILVRATIGKSMEPIEASMATLTGQLALIGPLALAVSLLGGWLLVSRALRPIARIARTAERIQATDLSQRIDAAGNDELARLGRTLNDMFARLQEAFDRQTRFTADASHELRTPLTAIAGNVELALKRPRTAEEYKELLEEIRDASDRMRSTVEGLLTLARADSKSAPLRRERVSLTAAADEIVRMCRPLAEPQGIRVAVESEGDVAVTADPDRMKELLQNLVINAIRYNRPGGTVTVRLKSEGGRGLLRVDDTGIGIPAEDLPHVFERFYRVDKARSREMGGSGLGLAIVKWIVDAHAGSIQVSSEPGVGTSFQVALPA